MKIRMLCPISGDWVASTGNIVDRPEAEALRLVAAGFAQPLDEPAPVVPAVESEKAVATRRRTELRSGI